MRKKQYATGASKVKSTKKTKAVPVAEHPLARLTDHLSGLCLLASEACFLTDAVDDTLTHLPHDVSTAEASYRTNTLLAGAMTMTHKVAELRSGLIAFETALYEAMRAEVRQ